MLVVSIITYIQNKIYPLFNGLIIYLIILLQNIYILKWNWLFYNDRSWIPIDGMKILNKVLMKIIIKIWLLLFVFFFFNRIGNITALNELNEELHFRKKILYN